MPFNLQQFLNSVAQAGLASPEEIAPYMGQAGGGMQNAMAAPPPTMGQQLMATNQAALAHARAGNGMAHNNYLRDVMGTPAPQGSGRSAMQQNAMAMEYARATNGAPNQMRVQSPNRAPRMNAMQALELGGEGMARYSAEQAPSDVPGRNYRVLPDGSLTHKSNVMSSSGYQWTPATAEQRVSDPTFAGRMRRTVMEEPPAEDPRVTVAKIEAKALLEKATAGGGGGGEDFGQFMKPSVVTEAMRQAYAPYKAEIDSLAMTEKQLREQLTKTTDTATVGDLTRQLRAVERRRGDIQKEASQRALLTITEVFNLGQTLMGGGSTVGGADNPSESAPAGASAPSSPSTSASGTVEASDAPMTFEQFKAWMQNKAKEKGEPDWTEDQLKGAYNSYASGT